MKVSVHMAGGLVRRRVGGGDSGILAPFFPDGRKTGRREAPVAILRTDGKDELPLGEERAIRRPDRVPRIVNTCGFGGRAVEFNDLKVVPGPELVFVTEAKVVAADEKSLQLLRNFVNASFERG